ncbi:N-acetylmuramate alpha-1-phosphate uridylyltransferase MurU [Pseudoalteromonas mariniglutinosa]|uniref:N-acetylmuramate alpha-1-phosphate uridylyltransferase MurU n=1 Tax=Pseudoalteromonas mariniglutinosa TaxID=206042 RepID=UPI00384DB56E
MKAMILAAGRGQRMMPLTAHIPKPMLEVAGQPLILHHIIKLREAGIHDIVINLAWQGEKIQHYFADGRDFGVNIVYSQEPQGGLETAGGIINALPLLGERFIVINGDIYTDYEPISLTQLHVQSAAAHIVLVENPAHNPGGDFALSHSHAQSQLYTFSGISCFHREFFADLTVQRLPLGPLLREKINNKQVSTELYLGQWDDIGTPQRLQQLNQRLADNHLT